ncbi:uncharacterized protein LOC124361240 [Homalodisca vitripennis]|uniref:uncharacterized protein LOC124361240 n=1 Tax=Homalodisca vitripennis TaxID=197043 RepID=UPI001EEB9C63|nr:uncharacterized protein LOC124361240 [Homalodisca vitripennis]
MGLILHPKSEWSSQESADRVPLCHFYFSHPFRVGDVCHGTLPLRHPRLPAPAPLAWRRGRTRARRRGARRYAPAAHLKAHVFLHPPGAALVPRTPPTIEELLWTIRDAWPPPPPRSLSLDR